MDYKSLTSLVLRLTGNIIVVSSVTSTPRTFAVYNELNFGRPDSLRNEDFAGLVSTGAQFIAGVILLFGGRGLANLFQRLRSPPPPT